MIATNGDGGAIHSETDAIVKSRIDTSFYIICHIFTIPVLGFRFTDCKERLVEGCTFLASYAPVNLRSAVSVKVEQGVFKIITPVQIADGGYHFISIRDGLGKDLARRADDARVSQAIDTFLDATLSYADNKSAILIRTTLHNQCIVKRLQYIL